jgi:hypothetical protein
MAGLDSARVVTVSNNNPNQTTQVMVWTVSASGSISQQGATLTLLESQLPAIAVINSSQLVVVQNYGNMPALTVTAVAVDSAGLMLPQSEDLYSDMLANGANWFLQIASLGGTGFAVVYEDQNYALNSSLWSVNESGLQTRLAMNDTGKPGMGVVANMGGQAFTYAWVIDCPGCYAQGEFQGDLWLDLFFGTYEIAASNTDGATPCTWGAASANLSAASLPGSQVVTAESVWSNPPASACYLQLDIWSLSN